ncbi:unnamed protein product [Leuciscus chuanchicus]
MAAETRFQRFTEVVEVQSGQGISTPPQHNITLYCLIAREEKDLSERLKRATTRFQKNMKELDIQIKEMKMSLKISEEEKEKYKKKKAKRRLEEAQGARTHARVTIRDVTTPMTRRDVARMSQNAAVCQRNSDQWSGESDKPVIKRVKCHRSAGDRSSSCRMDIASRDSS